MRDPFLGLGTTTLAAILSERNSVGYEVDPMLHDILRTLISQFDINRANALINERYLRHLSFVAEREANKKELKHFNEKLGCKVMTGQESDLIFHFIDEVKETLNTPEKLSFVSSYMPTLNLATLPIKTSEGLFAD